MFQESDRAPDFTLQTTRGQPITLSEVGREWYSVLLIFLRHLG